MMHKVYGLGEDGAREFRLPSSKRIDFLDIKNNIIYEVKPNNARAIRAGLKQLDIYMKELQTMERFQGISWNTVLETY
ncbi:hypothetical protein SNE25_24355 [Mucilaginibacter sabulilitoris]|uniref:Tox-REase-9 domain-containing protein n=1 Tax=Mucilaginibacter sabulilitoris TaxID=1173583 RepID=A0ABZ0TL62_9SPHI|nr:hypothetical protein [Mucilaginibacter sabulilitoris]WPU92464.1 hypothetical protein SNE25_24355 [Mucilaginibacter sabulilitoris]